jgi:hypothetical protein
MDPDFDKDDDVLMQYLEEEGLALVPIEFMRELMLLMEEHIVNVCGIDRGRAERHHDSYGRTFR